MAFYKDQLQREIFLSKFPQRIISLVPSITELLFDLHLENETAGITKFCVHPEKWFRTKTRVGGTKNVKIDLIASLQPELIIANKEENVKEQIEQLENIAPLWISNVENLADAFDMIKAIGLITNRQQEAHYINQQIESEFENIAPLKIKLRTCYLIWRDPYITIGCDTFIADMLKRCGFENIFSDCLRYPGTTVEDIKNHDPQLIFLSSEPYPFKQKHIEELKSFLPDCKFFLVDGEMFSWYGSRLVHAAGYFKKLVKQVVRE